MNEDASAYGFLFGADMEPGNIRRNPLTSESRFVGIGSIPAVSVAGLNLPMPDVDEIWGVVVTLPGINLTSIPADASVTLRSGTVVNAALLTDAASFGALTDAIAEAYYWELPRAWREALEGKAAS